MGYPYHTLVTPAILLDNPGITREEYIQLLDRVHTHSLYEFGKGCRWSSVKRKVEDNCYHKGIKGLAELLNLTTTQQWRDFNEVGSDRNGLVIRPPEYFPDDRSGKIVHKVWVHEKNVLESEREVEEISWGKLKVGEVWEEVMMGSERGVVQKILKETCRRKERDEEDEDFGEGGPRYKYKMVIAPFHSKGRVEKFATQEGLWSKWPQFHPDFVYDWKQSQGTFSLDMFCSKGFAWVKVNDRYSLAPETFDRISAGSNTTAMSFGYTDLVLTAEAIRNRAWKILSYKGLKHSPRFMRYFPEARKRYSRAVWDSHTSLSAKQQNMTISDLLRFRILPCNVI